MLLLLELMRLVSAAMIHLTCSLMACWLLITMAATAQAATYLAEQQVQWFYKKAIIDYTLDSLNLLAVIHIRFYIYLQLLQLGQ